MAVRGGLGVSSLVANLATAIFTRAQTDVILAEMVPGHGTLGMDLGVDKPESFK